MHDRGSRRSFNTPHWFWFRAVMALFLGLSFGYSLLMPIWEAPDEPAHFTYILHVLEHRSLPSYEVTPEAGQPPLYYYLASVPLGILHRIVPGATDDFKPPSLRQEALAIGSLRLWDWNSENYRTLPGPLFLRWLNILVGAAAVGFIYRGALIFTGANPYLSIAAASLIGLSPQFLHMSASVNNDPLAYLTGAVLFWLLGVIVTREIPTAGLLAIGLCAATLPFLIKFTAVPPGLTVAAVTLFRLKSHVKTHAEALWILGSGIALAILVAWILLGTSLGDNMLYELSYRLGTVRPDLFSVPIMTRVRMFSWSFWGNIGWVRVGLPQELILILSGLSLIGFLAAFRQSFLPQDPRIIRGFGILLAVLGSAITFGFGKMILGVPLLVHGIYTLQSEYGGSTGDRRRIYGFVWLMVLLAVAAFVRNFITTPKIQGRFLFPSVGAITTLIVYGWDLIADRRSEVILILVLVSMLLTNLWMWFAQVIPVFYQPFLG